MQMRWGLGNEEEYEYRRVLLVRARKGDVKAQDELMKKYGMRVYSDTERLKMPTYYDSGRKGSPPSLLTFRSTRELIQEHGPSSQKKAKSRTVSKKRPKTAAKAKKK